MDSNLSLDINQTTNSAGGCPANQAGADGQILEGFNDWANIQFNFRGSLDFGDGSRNGFEKNVGDDTNEMPLDTALALSRDVIDVKPDDKKNTIVLSLTQTVGVAIFSRMNDAGTERELYAPDIDPATLILRGTGGATWALPVKRNTNGKFQCSAKDVNRNGLVDLVCNFIIPANTLTLGETKVVLEGSTVSGQPVHSSDFIRVLP